MRSFTTLLVLALAVPAAAQVTKQERAGIVNFSKVDAVVACGGATDTAALDGLKADGFKAIINLRTAGEQGANELTRRLITEANTASEVLSIAQQQNIPLGKVIADKAQQVALEEVTGKVAIEVLVYDRDGKMIAGTGFN